MVFVWQLFGAMALGAQPLSVVVAPDGSAYAWLMPVDGGLQLRVAPTDAPRASRVVFTTDNFEARVSFSSRPGEVLVALGPTSNNEADDAAGLLAVDVGTQAVRRLLDAPAVYQVMRTSDPDVVVLTSKERVDRRTKLTPVQPSGEVGVAEEVQVSEGRWVWRSRVSRLELSTRKRTVLWEGKQTPEAVTDEHGRLKALMLSKHRRRWVGTPDQEVFAVGRRAVAVRPDGSTRVLARFDDLEHYADAQLASTRLHGKEMFLYHWGILEAIDVDTGERRTVWAPDGADVVWVEVKAGQLRWGAVDTDRWRIEVGPDGAREALVARFDGYALVRGCDDADRHCVVHAGSLYEAPHWYAWDVGAGTFVQLDDEASSKPKWPLQSARVPSRDGVSLTVHWTLPDPERFGLGPWPTVVQVQDHWRRGGRRSHSNEQWLAGHGYAVLSVRYRGSLGFGRAFRALGEGAWGGGTHQDLMDALDWAIAQGWAKADRVAVRGAGFGGYSALRAMTADPDRFACGIAGAASGSLLRRTSGGEWSYGSLGPKRQRAARSPDEHVDRLAGPVLVWHGVKDARMPIGQVEPFVERAVAAGKTVTFVQHPEEGHRLRAEASRTAQWVIDTQFLAQCLGGVSRPVGDFARAAGVRVPVGAAHVKGLVSP
ncbi:MAG: prolyl oligopeptidase family serine peptidase [Myxococcales bacterium]|nr:prolyl oligopeptidase family serine peptidase [Myxococcales bacterium]